MVKAPIAESSSFFEFVLHMRHGSSYPSDVIKFRVGFVRSTQGLRTEKDCGITAVVWGRDLKALLAALEQTPDLARQLVADSKLNRKKRHSQKK